MKKFKNPTANVAEAYEEMKRIERIREEGKKRGYDVFKVNEETRRIYLENEKRNDAI